VDFALSEIVECFGLITVWRGIGNAFDLFIYPHDANAAVLYSFAASHIVYLVIVLIQGFVYRRFSKMTLIYRLASEDLMHTIMILSAILAWKFYWNAADLYLYTEKSALYLYLIGHFGSFLIAIVLKVSAILVGPGISFLDGDITDAQEYFEINYISSLVKVSNGLHIFSDFLKNNFTQKII
jgi:hypothetical protein